MYQTKLIGLKITQILENEKVMINNQFIGQLKALKLELDLKIGALDTDIKSLKKAARKTVGPENLNRIEQIKRTGLVELKDDFKIYCGRYPIANLSPGKDYLNPELLLIIDDMVETSDQLQLSNYLMNWLNNKIKDDLKSLIDLKQIKINNPSIRALAYQLYESNGVIKREHVSNFLNKLGQEERRVLRELGVKFGRYHIFLYKLFKPNVVSLRIALWRNYHQKYFQLKPPKFGLNFLEHKNPENKNFMLLCGFEKFDQFFVRIDILERLFVKIMNSNPKNTNEIKLIPEMLNLLGCSKDSFIKLIQKMNYKTFEKNDETYFKYAPIKKFKKNNKFKSNNKDNPFRILKQMSFK